MAGVMHQIDHAHFVSRTPSDYIISYQCTNVPLIGFIIDWYSIFMSMSLFAFSEPELPFVDFSHDFTWLCTLQTLPTFVIGPDFYLR